MDYEHVSRRSRERVRDLRRRLEAAFGEFPVVDQPWPATDETYSDYAARLERGTLGGAGAWVADDAGRVLLIRERNREAWSEPSGHHEPGETLRETARREVYEETGIRIELTGIGLFQHLHVSDESSTRPTLHRVILVFTADRVGGSLRRDADEIAEAAWFETHPEPLLYDELKRLPIPYESD